MLNSIEGKRGMPRFKPPFPANFGLWGCPTTINNIETLANIPPIIDNGGEWFSKIGEPKHAGSLLYGLSGHINKPGIYELPSGTLLTDLIYKYTESVIKAQSESLNRLDTKLSIFLDVCWYSL